MKGLFKKITAAIIGIGMIASLNGVSVYADTFLLDEINDEITTETGEELIIQDSVIEEEDTIDDCLIEDVQLIDDICEEDTEVIAEETAVISNNHSVVRSDEIQSAVDGDIMYSVNPMYDDEFDNVALSELEARLASLGNTGFRALCEAEAVEYVTADELYKDYDKLVKALSEAMEARKTGASFYVSESLVKAKPSTYDFLLDLSDDAMSDDGITTSPKGGDYIVSHLKAWAFSGATNGNRYVMNFAFDYLSDAEQEKVVDTKVKAALDSMKLEGKDNYQKAKAIHDYITSHVSYKDTKTGICHTAYSAISNGYCVCQGYASLFYRMCREAGVPCRYTTGTANSGSSVGSHAWNYVKLSDRWYFVDVTWDDSLSSTKYFLKAEKSMTSHSRRQLKDFFDNKNNILATSEYKYTGEENGGGNGNGSEVADTVFYTIKFNKNCSKALGSIPAMTKVGYSKEVTLYDASNLTRAGYELTGWNTRSNGKGYSYMPGDSVRSLVSKNKGTITLYAQWKAIEYSVNYELYGGTNNVKNPSVHTVAKAVALKTPTRAGYIFKGFYTNSDFTGKKVTSIPKKDMEYTYYAKWVPITYKISFSANGKYAGGKVSGKMKAMTKLKYDQEYSLTANAYTAKSGRSFAGWNTRPDGSGVSVDDMASVVNIAVKNGANVTLYAQWN